MNQKAYSILFCALLASTFVHEIRAKTADTPTQLARVEERATENEFCELVCSSTDISIGLNITANENAGILVIVNGTANVALLLDVKTNIVAVFDGNTGSAVAINIELKTAVYIKTGGWNAAEISIQAYVAKLTSLSFIFQISGAVAFKLTSVPSEALKVVSKVIAFLVLGIELELQANATLALEILLTYATAKISLLRGVLKGFLTIIGTEMTIMRYDLLQLLNLAQALGVLCGKFSGGLSSLIEAGVVIKIKALAAAENGLAVLVVFILALGTKVDIAKALSSIFNDEGAFFTLVAQLGGNSNIGLNGLFKVLSMIVSFINGSVGIERVIAILIQFLVLNGNSNIDLSAVFKSTLSLLLEAIEKVGATTSLSGLVKTIQALINATLTIKGVMISAMITILIAAISKGSGSYLLQALVLVLVQLKSIISETNSMSMCLLVLILHLQSAHLIKFLIALGIDIKITGSGNVLVSILKSLASNVTALLKGNMYDVLASLAVIGTIVRSLNAAISATTSGSLKALLNASTKVITYIKALIQYLVKIPLGITSNQIAELKIILKHVTSIEGSIGVSLNSSYSVGVA